MYSPQPSWSIIMTGRLDCTKPQASVTSATAVQSSSPVDKYSATNSATRPKLMPVSGPRFWRRGGERLQPMLLHHMGAVRKRQQLWRSESQRRRGHCERVIEQLRLLAFV